MEYRKLISFGKSSYVVSLPKTWVQQNKLKKGDLVYLDEKDSNLILGSRDLHHADAEQAITISVDRKELKQIKREIIGAYINNCKTITLAGNEIKDKAKDLQDVIQSLVALEVMEQTSKKIVAKDFLNLDDVSIKTIVRKIDVIIRSMLEDAEKMFEEDNYESINYRDNDVNKLTFLMFRIIRYGLQNYTYMTKKLGATAVDLLGLWWLSFELESIADDVKRIARYMQRVKLDKKKQQEFKTILKDLKEGYLKMMKAYHEDDINSVHALVNERDRWIDACDAFYKENKNHEWVGFLTDRAKAAIIHVTHIGRLLYQSKTTPQ